MHSQFLEAGVELHVHGVERVQTAPVLYVSAGERKGRVQVSRGATGKALALVPETWVQILEQPPMSQDFHQVANYL